MQAGDNPASDGDVAAARSLLGTLLTFYLSYHNHKETMAYAATVLTVGAAASGLASSWPPGWLRDLPTDYGLNVVIPVAGVLFLCLVALRLIRYQLRRRRVGVMFVICARRVLVDWLAKPPSKHDLEPQPLPKQPPSPIGDRFLWPAGMYLPQPESAKYPRAFVTAWEDEQKASRYVNRGVLRHERAITYLVWTFFGLLAAKIIWLSLVSTPA